MKSILVVGQTPPPYGGQAIMIDAMLKGAYRDVVLHHVRMRFSREMDEMGRFRVSKVLHLFGVICRIFSSRITTGARILYYPPSSPERLPMLRDMAILCLTRWMFRKTIFHFHAAGISEAYPKLPRYLKPFFWWAYAQPDVAIRPSGHNPDDGAFLGAGHNVVVPNGLQDEFANTRLVRSRDSNTLELLFVGVIRESKGIFVLLDAVSELALRGLEVSVKVVGKFASADLRNRVKNRISELGLTGSFDFPGVLRGSAKHQAFLDADIFCFPSFTESFGLVVAEAMQFGLPVVASRAQGVQSLVVDGETGYLTPLGDSISMANCIESLVEEPDLRRRMGRAGRERFLEEYSLERFRVRMSECFSLLERGHRN